MNLKPSLLVVVDKAASPADTSTPPSWKYAYLMCEGVEDIVVHEFAHLATLLVNPTIASNPFWLWEAAALYLDGSGVPNTQELTCISDTSMPSLAELNRLATRSKVARLGYLIMDFVVQQWGHGALLSLIKTNGYIELALGVSHEQFEQMQHAFLLANYDFEPTRQSMSRDDLLANFSGNTLTNTKYGQSTFLAKDGSLYFGAQGVVQVEGQWSASHSNRICLELGDGQQRCSTWYQESDTMFLLQSDSDCVLQRWELAIGDVEGFTL